MHEVAFVVDQVSVDCPNAGRSVDGLAEIATIGAAGAATETVADADPEPPGPVHVSVYLLAAVSAPVLTEPTVALLPVHAPEAVQEIVFVLDHVSMELPSYAIDVGLADNDTTGAGGAPTVTVANLLAVPPIPVHEIEYVAFAVNAPVANEPATASVPDQAPAAVHDVALLLDHVIIDSAPYAIDAGLAEIATAGGAGAAPTATVADALALPPAPSHVIVYVLVAVSAPVLAEPEVGSDPDHAPDALHDVAFVLDHVSVELALYATDAGLADNDTAGGGAPTVTVADALVEPPAPSHARVKVVTAVRVPLVTEPDVGWSPDHPPEAMHVVALVVDHVSVDRAPYATDVGSADRVMVGTGAVTDTATDALDEPPAPMQAMVNVLSSLSEPVVTEPATACVPDHAPDAVHDVAFVLAHVSVELAALATVVGLAEIDTTGAGGTQHTITEAIVG